MDEAHTAVRPALPVTEAETQAAHYAFDELTREAAASARRLTVEQLLTVRAFFELGWSMAVRTGVCAPAVAGLPVAPEAVVSALNDVVATRVAAPYPGPALWQRVAYKGSGTVPGGLYWISRIHVQPAVYSNGAEVRYELCTLEDGEPVTVKTDVPAEKLTALNEYLY
ncbi:hypothetical protein [Streptomyces sp. NPDC094468]|uniref:hypothetical protein n=1 Tax=Streptomyces sp. NPDC094468 TaxID=3366066 RepID=UPI003821D4E0